MSSRSPLRGTRRLGVALAALAVAASALTACGGSTPADKGADEQASGAGFPRTVKSAMGDVKIPAKPKRVVVLDTGELDDVTMLGIKPVGAVSPHMKTEGGFPDYLGDKTKGRRSTTARRRPPPSSASSPDRPASTSAPPSAESSSTTSA